MSPIRKKQQSKTLYRRRNQRQETSFILAFGQTTGAPDLDQATHKLRQEMLDYLNQLIEDREAEDMRKNETGQIDPMRATTGRSALDVAVAQTQEIIHSLDRVLDQEPPEVITFRTSCNGLSRLKDTRCA
jgi:hypothetical protein